MTGQMFLTHLFMEEADPVMAKLASDILTAEQDGNIASLRKAIESSQWKTLVEKQ